METAILIFATYILGIYATDVLIQSLSIIFKSNAKHRAFVFLWFVSVPVSLFKAIKKAILK